MSEPDRAPLAPDLPKVLAACNRVARILQLSLKKRGGQKHHPEMSMTGANPRLDANTWLASRVTPPLRWVGLVCVGVVLAAIWYFRTRHLGLEAALNGFSPEQAAVLANSPAWFEADFPSGASEQLKSLIFQIYPLALAAGLDIDKVWSAAIAVELVALSAAAFWSYALLFPTSSILARAAVALLCTASSLLTPDLARFGFPFYGWYYGFAHAGFLVVCALFLSERLRTAAVALVLLFTIHPIIAGFAAIFCGVPFLVRASERRLPPYKQVLGAVIVVLVGCGAWIAFLSTKGTLTGGDVDPELFVALTRAQSYHWFPFYLGVFWDSHANHFIPLLSTLALIAWALSEQLRQNARLAREAAIGISALMATVAAGLVISEFVAQPTLIKLSLHRAGQSAAVIGSLFIVHALWRDLTEGDAMERGLAAVLLLLPFQSTVGLVPGAVGLRVALAAAKAYRRGTWAWPLGVATALVILIGLALLVYWRSGLTASVPAGRYLGFDTWLVMAGLIAAVWPLVWTRLPAATVSPPLALSAAMVIAMAAFGVAASPRSDLLADPARRERARNSLDAQLWAKANTPVGTLFMVDPTLFYMWRDKSHRPSFGTVREWLLISILYNSRAGLLEEGMRRYEALGVPRPYYVLNPTDRSMSRMLDRIGGDAGQRFLALQRIDFERLADTYGIRYVVFDRSKLKNPPPLKVVHENADFVIGSIR